MDILKQQTRELREVDLGQHVQRIHVSQLGGPLQFSSQFVMRNKPCIIEGAFEKWPALHKWNAEYITQKAGAAVVTVDITPHGRGDAVTSIDLTELQEEQQRGVKENVGLQLKQQREKKENTELGAQGSMQCFITPCERKMLVGQFFHLLRASRSMSGIVPYVQHQNSSLSEEFAFLLADTQPELSWANEIFGGPPEAVNLWIGDDRSVTSYHKDHYENMYAVVRGTKIFHLLPPSDLYRMYLRRFPAAKWQCSGTPVACESKEQESMLQQLGITRLQPQLLEPRSHVAWTEVDPEPEDPEQAAQDFPLYYEEGLPEPLIAEVGPGDLLYLPACWYHRVSQTCSQSAQGHDYVVAVNFWYDMAFSHSPWVSMKLVEGLAEALKLKDEHA
uniref:JmjC domain-containing protein n=1 Tax=Dunaliella tertiolecta TaxID=3047 RepID=A0A7S3R0P9_DUNTE